MDLMILIFINLFTILIFIELVINEQIIEGIKVVIASAITMVILFSTSYAFTNTTITTKYDVIEYKDIVYNSPKTVIETEVKGPFWSVFWNSKKYTVKGEDTLVE